MEGTRSSGKTGREEEENECPQSEGAAWMYGALLWDRKGSGESSRVRSEGRLGKVAAWRKHVTDHRLRVRE